MTRAGLLFYRASGSLMAIGLAAGLFAPQSQLGEFVSARSGRIAFGGAFIIAWIIFEKMLTGLVFRFTRPSVDRTISR